MVNMIFILFKIFKIFIKICQVLGPQSSWLMSEGHVFIDGAPYQIEVHFSKMSIFFLDYNMDSRS